MTRILGALTIAISLWQPAGAASNPAVEAMGKIKVNGGAMRLVLGEYLAGRLSTEDMRRRMAAPNAASGRRKHSLAEIAPTLEAKAGNTSRPGDLLEVAERLGELSQLDVFSARERRKLAQAALWAHNQLPVDLQGALEHKMRAIAGASR